MTPFAMCSQAVQDVCSGPRLAAAGTHVGNLMRSISHRWNLTDRVRNGADYRPRGPAWRRPYVSLLKKSKKAVDDFHIGPFSVFNQTFGRGPSLFGPSLASMLMRFVRDDRVRGGPGLRGGIRPKGLGEESTDESPESGARGGHPRIGLPSHGRTWCAGARLSRCVGDDRKQTERHVLSVDMLVFVHTLPWALCEAFGLSWMASSRTRCGKDHRPVVSLTRRVGNTVSRRLRPEQVH